MESRYILDMRWHGFSPWEIPMPLKAPEESENPRNFTFYASEIPGIISADLLRECHTFCKNLLEIRHLCQFDEPDFFQQFLR